jgi:hypothetical protein
MRRFKIDKIVLAYLSLDLNVQYLLYCSLNETVSRKLFRVHVPSKIQQGFHSGRTIFKLTS